MSVPLRLVIVIALAAPPSAAHTVLTPQVPKKTMGVLIDKGGILHEESHAAPAQDEAKPLRSSGSYMRRATEFGSLASTSSGTSSKTSTNSLVNRDTPKVFQASSFIETSAKKSDVEDESDDEEDMYADIDPLDTTDPLDMVRKPRADTKPWMLLPTPKPWEVAKEKEHEMNQDWRNFDPSSFPTVDQYPTLSTLEDKKVYAKGRKVHLIRTQIEGKDMCLTEAPNGYLQAMECEDENDRQRWYFHEGRQIMNAASQSMCLSYDHRGPRKHFLWMNSPCQYFSPKMLWKLDEHGRLFNEYAKMCISVEKANHYYVNLQACPKPPEEPYDKKPTSPGKVLNQNRV